MIALGGTAFGLTPEELYRGAAELRNMPGGDEPAEVWEDFAYDLATIQLLPEVRA